MSLQRRHLMVTAVGVPALSACDPAPLDRFHSLKAAREAVLGLLFKTPQHDSPWSLSQLLQHLAQSVEYSMLGYPEMKSAAFRAVIGNAAFAVFNARGTMSHSLTEPIPGAPALEADKALKSSVDRLLEALAAFEAWSGPLKPHFAYGELNKAQYTRAHLMHLANHWSQLRFPAPA